MMDRSLKALSLLLTYPSTELQAAMPEITAVLVADSRLTALARRELREEFIYCMQQADLRRNLEGFHRLPLSRGQTFAHVLMARSKMLRPASSCSSVMTSGARKRMTLP